MDSKNCNTTIINIFEFYNRMIEPFSIEKLKEYEFPKQAIERFQTRADFEFPHDRGYKNMFFASKKELKIYSGIDGARKFHIWQGEGKMTFPDYDLDLVPEYYRTKLSLFIADKKRMGGLIFDDDWWSKSFYEAEIASVKEDIEYRKNRDPLSFILPEYREWRNYNHLIVKDREHVEKQEHYLLWLNSLATPKYSEIFKKTAGNSIVLDQEKVETLEDVTINDTALNQMFKLLMDAELIDRDTKFFKDKKGGSKGHFYSSLVLFNEKGYFKRPPNKDEYLKICKHTFNVNISESTARNNKTRPGSNLTIPPFTSNY